MGSATRGEDAGLAGQVCLEDVPSIMKMKEMRQLQPYIIKHLNPNFPFSESILIKNESVIWFPMTYMDLAPLVSYTSY